ncbi:MAG: hypothetical protein IT274_10530 [Chitinophagales bacterium]|nr:hypothetical protein [Chitinophagales bacterium]HQO88362.1 hypothetical protein [Chitinophagales bacterium]
MPPLHSRLFLFFILFFAYSYSSAQDEYYPPIEINDASSTTEKTGKQDGEKAQEEDAMTALEKKKERLKRLRLGGIFGVQFGNFTYVNISPTVGYMVIKDRLEMGGGPIMIYQRFRYNSFDAYNFFDYGVDVYTRGFLYKGLFLEARYDLVNKPSYFNIDRRLNVHHLLLGGGYAAPISNIGVLNVSLLYNVLDNEESIHRGTFGKFPLILTIGFGFGIGRN